MHFDPQATTLVIFIGLLSGASALGWGVMAHPLKIAPKASSRYAIANTLLAIGITLTALRTNQANYLFWLGADICVLTSFLMLRWGTQHLFKLPSSLRFDLGLLAFTVAIMLTFEPRYESNNILGILFSVVAGIIFSQLAQDHYNALKSSLSYRHLLLILLPILLIVLMFMIRAVILWRMPEVTTHITDIRSAGALPMLWTYVVLTLALNVIMVSNAITRLVHKIRHQADRDYLTGLWNRRAMLKHLERIHHRWLRDDIAYSIILFDLDFFKQINDKYTHGAGDAALSQTATSLSTVVRATDVLCRYGGEEFLLLLPATDAQGASVIAAKLQQTLAQHPLIWHHQRIELSASFGFVTVQHADTREQLLNLADKAMYRAKAEGRNQICAAQRTPVSVS